MGGAEVYDPETIAETGTGEYVWERGERPLSKEYTVRHDISLTTAGDPVGQVAPMLQPARFYYDIPLTFPREVSTETAYTMLLRVLNPQGLPVSEEQKVRVRFPEDWREQVSAECLMAGGTGLPAAEARTGSGLW